MGRRVAIAALVLSMVTFAAQLLLATTTGQQVAWAVVGLLVYGLAVAGGMLPSRPASRSVIVCWAGMVGVILGFLPPRMQVAGGVEGLAFFFALIHGTALFLFLWLVREVSCFGPLTSVDSPRSRRAPGRSPRASMSLPMTEKVVWQARLLAELGVLLAPYGYSLVAATRSYRKVTASGWQSVHLALIQHPSDFYVVVNVAVRFDEIQRYMGDADDGGRGATMGCEYGNLIGAGQRRWFVASGEDVARVAGGIARACEVTLFPFLEEISELGAVHDVLSNDDRKARLLIPLGKRRRRVVEVTEGLLRRGGSGMMGRMSWVAERPASFMVVTGRED